VKIAIVVQRYGEEITGGSEYLCRMIAERMARKHEVDVLTTCATDYITWKNEYPQGKSTLSGVHVYRFPSVKTRDLESFNRFSEQLYGNYHSQEDELKWLEDQGPCCPALIDFLKSMSRAYDRLLFFTYLYYPTVHGLRVAPEKSVLVPTAHDEPAIRLTIFREVFSRPYALIFNTNAERDFVKSAFGIEQRQQVAGVGVDLPNNIDRRSFKRQQGLIEDYFYYGGRIDAGKGCAEMIDFYRRKKSEVPGLPVLLLSGHLSMDLPTDPSIIYLGYLTEQEKLEALQGATCVLIPSVMESLSLLLLEAFAARTPVLVNANSAVLREHCVKSNAGLYYEDYEEFSACLEYLMQRPHLRHQMGINGHQYVNRHYTWSRVISIYEQVLGENVTYENAAF
jgi:glycosyltransferase involved in cell wall biosynthesis